MAALSPRFRYVPQTKTALAGSGSQLKTTLAAVTKTDKALYGEETAMAA
jgi:hypothetical protein